MQWCCVVYSQIAEEIHNHTTYDLYIVCGYIKDMQLLVPVCVYLDSEMCHISKYDGSLWDVWKRYEQLCRSRRNSPNWMWVFRGYTIPYQCSHVEHEPGALRTTARWPLSRSAVTRTREEQLVTWTDWVILLTWGGGVATYCDVWVDSGGWTTGPASSPPVEDWIIQHVTDHGRKYCVSFLFRNCVIKVNHIFSVNGIISRCALEVKLYISCERPILVAITRYERIPQHNVQCLQLHVFNYVTNRWCVGKDGSVV